MTPSKNKDKVCHSERSEESAVAGSAPTHVERVCVGTGAFARPAEHGKAHCLQR
jgi:hypothetical protein